MEIPRSIAAASQEEEDLLRRAARATDSLLNLTPAFRADRDRFLATLRPHNGEIYQQEDNFADPEWAAANRDNWHNILAGREFADKWLLPYINAREIDPHYLAHRPFEEAMVLDGSLWGVTETEASEPHLLKLEIDLRKPKILLVTRIDDRIAEKQAAFVRDGGVLDRDVTERQVSKCERMLEVHRLREDGMTQEQVAEEIGTGARQVQRLEVKLNEILTSGAAASLFRSLNIRRGPGSAMKAMRIPPDRPVT